MPNEAGYDELRRVFDYLRSKRFIGPALAGEYGGPVEDDQVSITAVDADGLLDNPNGIVEAFCKEVGLSYAPAMLNWDREKDHRQAKDAFEKWNGFRSDAIGSSSCEASFARSREFLPSDGKILQKIRRQLTCPIKKKKPKTVESENEEWREKYGDEAQKVIRECVDRNIADYEYLKSFAIKFRCEVWVTTRSGILSVIIGYVWYMK
jgi:hypothetical protein